MPQSSDPHQQPKPVSRESQTHAPRKRSNRTPLRRPLLHVRWLHRHSLASEACTLVRAVGHFPPLTNRRPRALRASSAPRAASLLGRAGVLRRAPCPLAWLGGLPTPAASPPLAAPTASSAMRSSVIAFVLLIRRRTASFSRCRSSSAATLRLCDDACGAREPHYNQ